MVNYQTSQNKNLPIWKIDKFQSLKKLHEYVKAYNQDKPLTERIRGSMVSTLARIYMIYIDCHNRKDKQSIGKIALQHEGNLKEYPFLLTNRKAIATQCNIEPRTIPNHLSRFCLAKVLQKRDDIRKGCNFGIVLNQSFLVHIQ